MSVVYFIQSGMYVKVGVCAADRVHGRLRELQTGNPCALSLLGTIPGDAVEEARVHRSLADWHARGEWFHLTGELRRIIRDIADCQEIPIGQQHGRIEQQLRETVALLRSLTESSQQETVLGFRKAHAMMDIVALDLDELALAFEQ